MRLEHLADCERATRKYIKQDVNYWKEAIKESRAGRHVQSLYGGT